MFKKFGVKEIVTALLVVSFVIPWTTFAHQPRIPEGDSTAVQDPEVSKAYYSQLQGSPHTYSIDSERAFSLYVNILAPDIVGQKRDISAKIIKNWDTKNTFAILDSNTFEWTQFFEPFWYDTYWKGPEYKANVWSGRYDIIVSSNNNDSKYSLAVGEAEVFDFGEISNALSLVPKIKRDFFDESPISFFFSPFGWGIIVIMFVLAFLFGFVFRLVLRQFTASTPRNVHNNIGQPDRLIRLMIGIFLLVWAITSTWSPILLFFSGFTFFEAIFSWCWLYAILGKDTCPLSSHR